MKKLLTLLVSLGLVLGGCSNSQNNQDPNMKHVGVLQIIAHGSLDQAYQGFKDGMAEAGYIEGENVTYDFQNAEGDKSNMTTIAQKFVADQDDLILAIGTEAAQTASQETSEIPIVGTAITDYVEVGLAQSNEQPGGNVTGLSDATPMDRQIDLLLEFAPTAKTIGIIYCSSEANSKIQADQAIEEIESRGLKAVVKTIADQTVISDTLQSMTLDIDALYIPSDNTLASAMGAVETITTEAKIPTIVAVEKMCADGGLASVGIDYYDLGKQTGYMAAKILNGEANPATTPIETADDSTIYYNQQVLEDLGLKLPESIQDSAKPVEQENE